MKKPEPHEENMRGLLKAAHPTQGKIDARLRAGVYGQLAHRLAARPAFPPLILGLIGGVVLILEAFTIAMGAGWISAPGNELAVLLIAGVASLNLLSLPVACVFIVIRRKNANPIE